MNNKRSIKLSDGKYEFYEHNHIVRCDRYGERWREFIGDKAIRALFDHATEQAEQIAGLNKAYETLTEEDCHTIGLLTEENQRLKTGHCSDCCCARSWKALGVDKYDGKSIPEHIEQLHAENKLLKDFARFVIKQECWGYDVDGAEIQELAEKLGFIKEHIATEDDVDEFTDFDPGDKIYKFTDVLKGTGQ